MARIPNRRTILKVCSASVLLFIAAGGVFFVFAPYQASRLRADIVGRFYTSGEDPLVLATAAEDGSYFKLGGVLRQHLDAYHSYKLDVQATRGSLENLQMLHDGKADLALIQGGLTTERDGLVALANLGRQYVHLIVPADSNIEEFRDLAGKRVGVGPVGGGGEALAESVFGFFNFAEEAMLIHDHNPNLREAFLDGEIDAAFTVYSLFAPALEQLLNEGWYRLVPVAEADAVSRYLPGAFMETLPANLYGPDRSIPPDTGVPFRTISVSTLLVAERTLPNRQVYTILELIFSGDFLKAARLTGLDEEIAQKSLHLPLHAAAEAFYNRRNPISSDRFEILSFFLAGIVCLASVVHYVLGHHRFKVQNERRRAIRPYFEAMMDFGDEIEVAANPAHLSRLIHKVMATQRGAEREWLEGHFDTEDMENLYAVYSLRCNNAFNKIFDLHLQSLRGLDAVQPPRPDSGSGSKAESPFPRFERDNTPVRPRPVPVAPPVERDPAPAPKVQDDDDAFFTGAALAGIDTTKGELAERLPGRYDPTLLYDTEASGAGSVRVRKAKPQADLQAVVEKDVPERRTPEPVRPAAKPVPIISPEAETSRATPRIQKPVDDSTRGTDSGATRRKSKGKLKNRKKALKAQADGPRDSAPKPASRPAAPPPAPAVSSPVEQTSNDDDSEGGPDQLMLF